MCWRMEAIKDITLSGWKLLKTTHLVDGRKKDITLSGWKKQRHHIEWMEDIKDITLSGWKT